MSCLTPTLVARTESLSVAVLHSPPELRDWQGSAVMEPHPERIGRYRICEVQGEGGFGIVYRAEQTEPLTREVALKVIKPGMDSAQIIRRFEAERQALARMEHTNIAAVLDAGTTEAGPTLSWNWSAATR